MTRRQGSRAIDWCYFRPTVPTPNHQLPTTKYQLRPTVLRVRYAMSETIHGDFCLRICLGSVCRARASPAVSGSETEVIGGQAEEAAAKFGTKLTVLPFMAVMRTFKLAAMLFVAFVLSVVS
eukprot:1718483-Rhodomonas_salina.2